ncbi:hypothetical protein INT46_003697 [Mucor plumbeus]|uniref:PNPLA domain-containing protein n=1 Tax=Mucor plumbeus TaxID=97098 RepID=A0A8H7UTS8_9FUNG|nr:hypothetical protein INT46_003697 [Mucor plumbeus]
MNNIAENISKIARDPLKYAVAPIIYFVYSSTIFLYGYLLQPWMRKWEQYKDSKPENRLLLRLKNAETFDEWQDRAAELDRFVPENKKNDKWRRQPASRVYDYKLIASRLEHLQKARDIEDTDNMTYLLRGVLLRNFGGICDRKLFSHSYLGTKQLIEEYMEEVVSQIEYIETTPDFDAQAKIKFFSDSRQSFGCSALVLQGGTALALYHIGVVKALNEQGLLPRIISGTAIGAMIAALICIHTDEELPNILQPDGINLTAFSKKGQSGHFKRRITRFMKYGKFFKEIYATQRNHMIADKIVSSSRTQEVPQLLNYLTAPNVLIWSAACCSTASVGLFGSCNLMAKDKNGNIVKWISSAVKWNHWSETSPAESEAPLYRLSELFNVNHFIVSQASIYAIPFIAKAQNLQHETLLHKFAYILASEFKHRLYQLDQLHLLPHMLRGVIEEKMSGNVNVVPDLAFSDFNILFSNPSYKSLAYWILHGERSLLIEATVLRLKAMNVEREPVVVRSRFIENKKRARSMH